MTEREYAQIMELLSTFEDKSVYSGTLSWECFPEFADGTGRNIIRPVVSVEKFGEENTTRLIKYEEELFGQVITYPITECCKTGPITDEKYCSECGKKIVRE